MEETPTAYLMRMHLPELIDGLMLKLTDERPANPKPFMANVLMGAAPPLESSAAGNVKLFILRASANCHGVWLLLRLSGIDFEITDIDLQKGEQMADYYVSMNPMHTVPLIKDSDGTAVWESNAILRHLSSRYVSAQKFYPVDHRMRAHCEMALDWRQTTLAKHIHNTAYIKLGITPPDSEKEAASTEALTKPRDGCFSVLADFFLSGKPFICGDDLSIADLAICTYLKLLEVTSIELPSSIRQYMARFEGATGSDYPDILSGGGSGFGLQQFIDSKK